MALSDIDAYRCAKLVLGEPDPDAFVRERLKGLEADPEGTAAWRQIAAAMAVLRADGPVTGQSLH